MKKIMSLIGVGILILTSASIVSAQKITVINKGDVKQEIFTIALAESGDIKVEVKNNKYFNKIKFDGEAMITGDADAFSTTRAIANQFRTNIKKSSVKVVNKGEGIKQDLITDASVFSGKIKFEVNDSKHFDKIELGGGKKTTGYAYADSRTKVWANIFDVKVH